MVKRRISRFLLGVVLLIAILASLGCAGDLRPPLTVKVDAGLLNVSIAIRNGTGQEVFLSQSTNGVDYKLIAGISGDPTPTDTQKLSLGSWEIQDHFKFEYQSGSGQAVVYSRRQIVLLVKVQGRDFTLRDRNGKPTLEPTHQPETDQVSQQTSVASRGP